MKKIITIPKPIDAHVHFRTGVMMEHVVPFTAQQCQTALVMPNTVPPILTGADATDYHETIQQVLKKTSSPNLQLLMAIQITDSTNPALIGRAKKGGVTAGKIYPRGLTTNSENGVEDYRALAPVFQRMEEEDMVLCLHGEHPKQIFEGMNKENAFFDEITSWIVETFSGLRVVMEHITDARTVEKVRMLYRSGAKIAATITVHHLMLTLDDVIGYSKESQGKLQPHHFCKPVAKLQIDMSALRQATFSGQECFFLGTDSAPHPRDKKECESCCAGIFTAPVMMQSLVTIFEEWGGLNEEILTAFTSGNAARFYDLELSGEIITLVRKPFEVPEMYGDVRPFLAGQTLPWSIEG